jgi:hypothetical protein
VFVAAVGLVLVAACFMPYYTVSGAAAGVSTTHTVLDHTLGTWRLSILAVAALTVAVGVANSILRVGQPGAVGVFFLLRFAVLVQLGLWVAVIFLHHFSGASTTGTTVTVGWVAYSAAAVALVGLAGSLASMGKSDTA